MSPLAFSICTLISFTWCLPFSPLDMSSYRKVIRFKYSLLLTFFKEFLVDDLLV